MSKTCFSRRSALAASMAVLACLTLSACVIAPRGRARPGPADGREPPPGRQSAPPAGGRSPGPGRR